MQFFTAEGELMSWKKNCAAALDAAKLFENSMHRMRFKELVDCYINYPFFTKGLCKCMYLSAWDDEHFCIMLSTLSEMTLGHEKSTDNMRTQGELLAEEQTDEEYYVYQLSNAFLDNVPFHLDTLTGISPEIRHIIVQALRASEVIDSLSDE